MLHLPVPYMIHSLDELLQLGDTVVLIKAGSVVEAGPIAEISATGPAVGTTR
jgi:ABC-type molybdate transport system ATPase subunit